MLRLLASLSCFAAALLVVARPASSAAAPVSAAPQRQLTTRAYPLVKGTKRLATPRRHVAAALTHLPVSSN